MAIISAAFKFVARFRWHVPLVVLSVASINISAGTTHPGPPDDVPEILNTETGIERYLSDLEYRKAHDRFSHRIWAQLDPNKTKIRRFAIADIALGSLLKPREQGLEISVIEEFRISAFSGLSVRFKVSEDEGFEIESSGRNSWYGKGIDYWSQYSNKAAAWTINLHIIHPVGPNRSAKDEVKVAVEMRSSDSYLTIEPIETVVSSVPVEFDDKYLVVQYLEAETERAERPR